MPSIVKYGSTVLKHQRAVVLAGVDLDAEVVAGAEDVLLLDRERSATAFRRWRSRRRAAGCRSASPSTVIVRSTWSGAPGTSLVSTLTSLEVAEAVDAVARQLDLVGRRTRTTRTGGTRAGSPRRACACCRRC